MQSERYASTIYFNFNTIYYTIEVIRQLYYFYGFL